MRLRGLILYFEKVTFHHIPREQNRLADALANEAADGKGINERIH
jgi:ribonuclease HI